MVKLIFTSGICKAYWQRQLPCTHTQKAITLWPTTPIWLMTAEDDQITDTLTHCGPVNALPLMVHGPQQEPCTLR